LLSGNEIARALQQRRQHLERLFLETDPAARLPQLS
jgi:hypothetical protein